MGKVQIWGVLWLPNRGERGYEKLLLKPRISLPVRLYPALSTGNKILSNI